MGFIYTSIGLLLAISAKPIFGSSIDEVAAAVSPRCPQLPKSMYNYDYWLGEITELCKKGLTDREYDELQREIDDLVGRGGTQFGSFLGGFVTGVRNRIRKDNVIGQVSDFWWNDLLVALGRYSVSFVYIPI